MKTTNRLLTILFAALIVSCQQNQESINDVNAVESEPNAEAIVETEAEAYVELSADEVRQLLSDYNAGNITDFSDYVTYDPIGKRCDTVGKAPEEVKELNMKRIMLTNTFFENNSFVVKKSKDELLTLGVTPEYYDNYMKNEVDRVKSGFESGSLYLIDPQTGLHYFYDGENLVQLTVLKKKS